MLLRHALLAFTLAALAAAPGGAQPAAAKPEVSQDGITRQQAEAILGELREMRLLLERLVKAQGPAPAAAAPAPPANVTLKIAPGSLMLGDKNAPLTMVEYIDLQCPFCKRFEDDTFADIRKNLIDTGKLRYYSRDFPLDMHANARKAAVAVHCAAEQGAGQFWRMREVLLINAANLAADSILEYAKTAGLEPTAFGSCLAGTKYDEAIRGNIGEASSLGVQATPSFILGKSTPDGVIGTLLVGAMPYTSFEAEVKKLEAK